MTNTILPKDHDHPTETSLEAALNRAGATDGRVYVPLCAMGAEKARINEELLSLLKRCYVHCYPRLQEESRAAIAEAEAWQAGMGRVASSTPSRSNSP